MRLHMSRYGKIVLAGIIMTAVLAGCHKSKTVYRNPDDPDSLGGTGIDSGDVRTVCQKMCREILATPQLTNVAGRPRIALTQVDNRTRFRIDAQIFTEMMRDELIKFAGDKIAFLAREDLPEIETERSEKREGHFDATGQKKLRGADYFLTGTLRSISKAAGSGRSDYIVYMFRLVDAESSEIVWSGRYETKKEGIWGTVYR